MKTLYFNGKVYTGNLPLAEAFIVEDDRFVFVGSSQEAKAWKTDQSIDLHGCFVCPGFNDSHMHLTSYGLALRRAKLNEHTDSLSHMLDYFCQFAKENPPAAGGWLVGRGWNHDYFSDVSRMPDRYDLDQVSTEYPVAAVRCCGHCMVINSKALEILGITADTPQPDGGSIGIADGIPDGRFYDNAMDLVYRAFPDSTLPEIKDMIRAAARSLNSFGVTSCHSDDYGMPWKLVNQAYKELEMDGELTVRVYEQSNFNSVEALREFIALGNTTGAGTDFFRIGPLKMLGDGSLGSRTAYLSIPYADDPSTCGLPVFSQELLDQMIMTAHENGMQIAVHAIGDACLDRVLSAYEKALKKYPREDHRHGIVHCQITRPDQLKRMAEMKLHIYAQSIFLDYDSAIVRDRVGDEMAESSYNWKTLMESGLCVSNGTDCPVELPIALRGIQCAVTRSPLNGSLPPYLPRQAFTVQEALDSYTSAGARGSFEEDVKGRIQPGMLADFTVLGENIFETNPDNIASIPVLQTYVGGKLVYNAK